jgi:hypothetical protein
MGGEEGGAEGDRGWDDNTCSIHVPKISMNLTNLGFLGGWAVGAGCVYSSRSIERFESLIENTRRDRCRVCAKFESSRRFRGSNMNHNKKPRRCRCLALDSCLDSSIHRFTNSLAYR